MQYKIPSILALTFGFGLVTNVANSQPSTDNVLSAALDQLLAKEFKPDEPGATALVARQGKIIYKRAIGMANLELDVPLEVDQIIRIGSITKQFTAVAILQLMEQGKLSLQDEITKFIPDYPTQGNTITIEHLLTHTSGIQSYTGMKDFIERLKHDVTPLEMIDHFKNEPMEFSPGEKFHYNNSGYFLLGYIIEQITGKSYGEYIEEHIFKPLGMTNSMYGNDKRIVPNRASPYSSGEHGFENAFPLSMTQPYAAGSIQSTVEDLYKWHQALQAGKLIKKENLVKAFTSYTLTDGKQSGYGYGWEFAFIQQSPTIEHGGAINGASTMAIYLPKEDVFVAVFANCDCHNTKDIAARLAARAIGQPYEHEALTLPVSQMQVYTGVYENAAGEQRVITLEDNQLFSQRGRNSKFLIQAYAPDQFYFEDALLTIAFARNAQGTIDKLITHNRDGKDEWIKTDKPAGMPQEILLDVTTLENYVGEYAIEQNFTFVVTRDGQRLFIQATGQEAFEVFAETTTLFFAKVVDAQFEFLSDDNGKVNRVHLKQGGMEIDAKRIK